jgi:hypothetical protein
VSESLSAKNTNDPVVYARSLVGHARFHAQRLARQDLVEELDGAAAALDERVGTVAAVVGMSDAGKSTLVNACVGRDLLPVDLLHPTPVSVWLYAGDGTMAAHRVDADHERRERIPDVDALQTLLTGPTTGTSDVGVVEVTVDRWRLAAHLALIDTPSWSLSTVLDRSRVFGCAPDVVVLVSDAGQELCQVELDVATVAVRRGMQCVLVLTKVDLHPDWRRIRDVDEGHLARAGLKVPIFPVGLRLAELGRRRGDADTIVESGLPALTEMLDRSATGHRILRACDHALDVVDAGVADLSRSIQDQLELLNDPEAAARGAAARADTEARLLRLQGAAAKWRERLGEGLERQSMLADHLLRTGLARILTSSLEEISNADPAVIWEAFAPKLQSEVEAQVARVFSQLDEGIDTVVEEVGRLFGEEGGIAPVELSPTGQLHLPDEVHVTVRLDEVGRDRAGTLVNTLRNSAAGFSITGLIARSAVAFVGTAAVGVLLLPVGAAMTVFLGQRAYKASQEAELNARRRAAASSVRRYLDAVTPEVMLQLRSEVMTLRRDLNDRFGQLAVNRHQQVQAQVRASALDVADREQRMRELTDIAKAVEVLAAHSKVARAQLVQRGAA